MVAIDNILDRRLGELDVVLIERPTEARLIEARVRNEGVRKGRVEHCPLLMRPPILGDVLRGMCLPNIRLDHVCNRIIVNEGTPSVEE
jgi:hypothetical protein